MSNSISTSLVTGAAGFIASQYVRDCVERGQRVVVLDSLSYAGHKENLDEIKNRIEFVEGDINNFELLDKLYSEHKFDSVLNFAAESHVDNSITGPSAFIQTNINGTFQMLEAARRYWQTLSENKKKSFRYLQVSTDEVYGSLGDTGKFSETTPYAPNSPYSASKAGADQLVRAWFHTYGLPTLITNCSNNYGQRQFPEKLIPVIITKALSGKPLPVYGDGKNVRDWIHVEDHCAGIYLALSKGRPGETYCFGGNSERSNIDVVSKICDILDEKKPRGDGASYRAQITYVEDRLGHDRRYAIDDSKAERELGFTRKYQNFEEGLAQTVNWYLENKAWIDAVTKGERV